MNHSSKGSIDSAFLGHPKGLQTLFLTEMWERMSYYGMRGLLVIFMTAAITDGGMAMTTATATAIYGIYTASVYFMGLPGGWLADRLIGGQKAIWYGGIIIMLGIITMSGIIIGPSFPCMRVWWMIAYTIWRLHLRRIT